MGGAAALLLTLSSAAFSALSSPALCPQPLAPETRGSRCVWSRQRPITMTFDPLGWLKGRLGKQKEPQPFDMSSRPERIILVRHGQSDGNANRRAYERTPDSQIALTDVGYAQGVVAGLQIRKLVGNESVRFYYSPYLRARQTLLAVLKAFDSQTVELSTEPRLREQDFGEVLLTLAF
eukprot:scaffold124639_cov31-Tisochrysis_lutea.AAC.4